MKLTIWDILSVLMILATLCLCGGFGVLWADESNSFNPFPPPTLQPTIHYVIPTATATSRIRELPATWTPTPGPTDQPEQPSLRASSTPMPTFTSFVIASFTPSITPSNTPTVTPTVTATSTVTLVPTFTQVPTITTTPTP